ncbi:MAG TPA: FAD-dependent oxidoreductase [Fodinibius sp.]|nr:FAD-dependent oxidoreductase [Fodinibius sp.]
MTDNKTMVIIGTGRAGVQAAMTLREENATCRVILISEDSDRPYDKVPLSKHYLYGKPGFHSLYFNDENFYADNDIELWLDSPVAAIDTKQREVTLRSGERQGYDQLLLATGLAVNRWTGPGADLTGVHYLRTLADAKRLRKTLYQVAEDGGSVAVVGSGWIGCEAAAAAYEHGVSVSLIGRNQLLLAKQVGPEIGEFFRRAHVEHGIQLHLDTDVTALHGTDSVQAVELAGGKQVTADVVLFGIGAAPRTELAVAAGLDVAVPEAGGGIVTDEYLQTSAAGIFAAGDVANVPNAALGTRSRREHHMTAKKQGEAAARSMLGTGKPYAQVPFFFSDQFDIWMETTGDLTGADDFVMREYPGKDKFIAFWLRNGKLAAGMNVNIKGVPGTIEALIKSGKQMDRDKLTNADIPLRELL